MWAPMWDNTILLVNQILPHRKHVQTGSGTSDKWNKKLQSRGIDGHAPHPTQQSDIVRRKAGRGGAAVVKLKA